MEWVLLVQGQPVQRSWGRATRRADGKRGSYVAGTQNEGHNREKQREIQAQAWWIPGGSIQHRVQQAVCKGTAEGTASGGQGRLSFHSPKEKRPPRATGLSTQKGKTHLEQK